MVEECERREDERVECSSRSSVEEHDALERKEGGGWQEKRSTLFLGHFHSFVCLNLHRICFVLSFFVVLTRRLHNPPLISFLLRSLVYKNKKEDIYTPLSLFSSPSPSCQFVPLYDLI